MRAIPVGTFGGYGSLEGALWPLERFVDAVWVFVQYFGRVATERMISMILGALSCCLLCDMIGVVGVIRRIALFAPVSSA